MIRNPDVTIVVPAYREVENITGLVMQLFDAIGSTPLSAELLLVDDSSCDGTIELCEELATRFPIRLIVRTEERGLATAVIRGLQEATGEYVVVMDADLSHSPSIVPELLRPLQADTADFVIGSRYVQGGSIQQTWGMFRLLNSRFASVLAIGLTRVKDPMAGFFAMRRNKLGNLSQLNPCGYKIGLELIVRCDCQRIAEVPIHFEDRRRGESKLSLREQWLYIQHLCRLYAFRYPEWIRMGLFGIVGASGMVIDLLSFRSLSPVTGFATGRAFAIWISMTWNFEMNRRFTFRKSADSILVDYLQFSGACCLGGLLSWGTSMGLISTFDMFRNNPVGAAVIGTFVAAFVNYTLCRLRVFGKRRSIRKSSAVPSRPISAAIIK